MTEARNPVDRIVDHLDEIEALLDAIKALACELKEDTGEHPAARVDEPPDPAH